MLQLKKHMQLSMLLTLAVVISIIESFFPLFGGIIPGFKLGLANVVIVFALYVFRFKEALFISLGKVLLVAILRTGLFSVTFFFSLSGALVSVLVMALFKKFNKFSIVGVSLIGAIGHGMGQIFFAVFFLESWQIINYLPIVMLLSIPSGIIVGLLAKNLIVYFDINTVNKQN